MMITVILKEEKMLNCSFILISIELQFFHVLSKKTITCIYV